MIEGLVDGRQFGRERDPIFACQIEAFKCVDCHLVDMANFIILVSTDPRDSPDNFVS